MFQDDNTHVTLYTDTATATTTATKLYSFHHRDLLRHVTNATVLTVFFFLFSFSLLSFAAFSSTHFFSCQNLNLTRYATPGPKPGQTRPNSLGPSSTQPGLLIPDIGPTRPEHIMFCLSGSAATWPSRRHYARLWWSPRFRGHVWLDRDPAPLPGPLVGPGHRVSRWPARSPADRMARVLKEGHELGLPGVRWYVMGDDDTMFFPENLAAVLSKHDHRGMQYVGGISESMEQVELHGYGTAFGGGGFAISSGLAKELVNILDGCIVRYHKLYGSDEKVGACVAELGLTLTKEPGFHQFDIRGDPYGILAAHPVAPLVSLHHLHAVNSLFLGQTREDSIKKLMKSYHIDPRLTLQQSFCYDHEREWSISVSWGYTAQLYPSLVPSRVLGTPFRTFRTWRSNGEGPFVFNTRPFGGDLCTKPVIYYVDKVKEDTGGGTTLSTYKRNESGGKCEQVAYANVTMIEKITVVATKSGPDEWLKAPRRRCCDITKTTKNDIEVMIRSCKQGESMSL